MIRQDASTTPSTPSQTESVTTANTLVSVGSSQMGAAVGIHPTFSRRKLWRKLLGKETEAELKPNKVQEQMAEQGVAREHLCVQEIEIQSGILFDHTGENQLTRFKDRIRSTPDGLCGNLGCEAKCPPVEARWYFPTIPYICQCQVHCYVHELEAVFFGRWRYGDEPMVWRINRSDEYIKWMLDRCDIFLEFIDKEELPTIERKKQSVPDVHMEKLVA